MALAIAGLLSSGALEILGSGGPASPDYAIRVVGPDPRAPVTSPVAVHICERRRDGSTSFVRSSPSVLLVTVDGREVLTTSSPRFALAMPPGTHVLQVELTDGGHREYRPPVVTRMGLLVEGRGPLRSSTSCGSALR